jgi:histidine triad (HIT) family protein
MTIFSKIITGQIPSYKIAENEKFYAFLDIFPCTDGHTLVVPKVEIDAILDLPTEYLDGILSFAKPIGAAIKKAFPCNRVNIITVGFEVPHAHIHLLPMQGIQDMHVLRKKTKPSPEHLQMVQKKIVELL